MKESIRNFITFALVVIVFTGCGRQKLKNVTYFSDNTYQPISMEYDEQATKAAMEEWTRDAEKLDDDVQKIVNEIGQDVCKFLNTELGANWRIDDIGSYSTKVRETISNASLQYGAYYYGGKMYLDESFCSNFKEPKTKYVVAHELIHYMRDLNCEKRFAVKSKDNTYYGIYFEEAVVDSLAKRYIRNEYPDLEVKSGYNYIRMSVDLMYLQCPSLFKYFFEDDIDKLQKEFDKNAKKRVICVGSSFEKMISMLDETIDYPELISDRLSAELTFFAITTSAEYSAEFLDITGEEGIETEMFISYMY